LGAPLPSTFIVVILGAFIHENLLNIYTTSLVVLVATIAGDCAAFGVGRLGQVWIPKRFKTLSQWKKTEKMFIQHAGLAIYSTRCIFTTLALPTSLIAGDSGYSFTRFIFIDFLGESTWIAFFGCLGYAFSSQSELISDIGTSVTGSLMGLLIVALGGYIMWRFRNSWKFWS
jgi:membrane protein DedA with SNARE-associated domain